jgi:hypothetical protein
MYSCNYITRHKLAWKRWKEYCRQQKLDPYEAPNVDAAIGFVGFLATIRTITAWSSYKGMIDGVKANMELNNIDTQSFYHNKFKRVKIGLQRSINVSKDKKKKTYRAFCEPSLLQSLLPHFRTKTVAQRNAMRVAIVASAGASRMGELTATKHNAGVVPLDEHVKVVNENKISIFLQRSKTDKVHKGSVKKISDLLVPFSVVKAVNECRQESYKAVAQGKPFFCDEHRRALTADSVMEELHLALKSAGHSTRGFGTKCFRRGSTKSLKRKGGSKKDIRKLGSWSTYSNCYKTYIQSDTSDFDDDYILPGKTRTQAKHWHVVRHKEGRSITLRKGVTS